MSIFDKLFGRNEPEREPMRKPPIVHPGGQGPYQSQPRNADEEAIARYKYMLRTAPPEAIEQAHAEAFAKLTPEQRRLALQQLSAAVPEHERPYDDDPRSLARAATRAEMREPGMLERTFGGRGMGMGGMGMGGMGGGMGMGGMLAGGLLAGVAGSFIGSAIANQFFSNPMHQNGFMNDFGNGGDHGFAGDNAAYNGPNAADDLGMQYDQDPMGDPGAPQDNLAAEYGQDPLGDPGGSFAYADDPGAIDLGGSDLGGGGDFGGDFGGGEF
jgi:hypothetical protein